MKELIERLERATEGSRELDALVHVAINSDRITHEKLSAGYTMSDLGDTRRNAQLAQSAFISAKRGACLHYTTSIDAALTLLPDGGKRWRLFAEQSPTDDGPWWHVTLRRHAAHEEFTGGFTTPAIAICLASLRARSKAEE